jgi:amidase
MAPAIAGTPIGCLPMGLVNGLPVGVGLVSRANEEDKLISAMAQIEKILDLGVLTPTFIKD